MLTRVDAQVRHELPQESPEKPDPGDCHGCQELRRAEAAAHERRDYSGATDCRVLLRRHRGGADCSERRGAE
ncbi:hypothetical protein ACFCV8_19565 [Streptomyces sp. NPDC056347]|uniref:hypothetical protein n=1 Tax=Streptomyces sp. NPDC056347 TaxID=3345790 RepID=UPI0035E35C62